MLSTFGIILLLLPLGTPTISVYPIYYLEDMCLPGINEVTYPLKGTNSSRSSIVLRTTRSTLSRPYTNCTIKLEQDGDGGVVLNVGGIDFSSSITDCTSYIKIYQSSPSSSVTFCGIDENHMKRGFFFDTPLLSKGYKESRVFYDSPSLSLYYHNEYSEDAKRSDTVFEIVATTYSNVPCNSDEFRCDNDRCIWKGLICDERNNCGDFSDEQISVCDPIDIDTNPGTVTRITWLGGGGTVIFTIFIYACLRMRTRNRVILAVPSIYIPQENSDTNTQNRSDADQHPPPSSNENSSESTWCEIVNPLYKDQQKDPNRSPPPPYSAP